MISRWLESMNTGLVGAAEKR